jgi:hypothetical protein
MRAFSRPPGLRGRAAPYSAKVMPGGMSLSMSERLDSLMCCAIPPGAIYPLAHRRASPAIGCPAHLAFIFLNVPTSTVPSMSGDLTRRPGGPPSRRSREKRAYQLAVGGGVAGAVAVIGGILALVGVIGWGLPFVAVVIAIVCWFLFRRAVS